MWESQPWLLSTPANTAPSQRSEARLKDIYYEEIPGSVQLLLNELPFHVRKPAVRRGLTRLLDGIRDITGNILSSWTIRSPFVTPKCSETSSEASSEPDNASPSEQPCVRNILFCISRLRSNYHRTVMVLANIAQIQGDEELFKALKKAYRQEVREFQWWFSMRMIVKIRFVQVRSPCNSIT
jgi:hypothetical protein